MQSGTGKAFELPIFFLWRNFITKWTQSTPKCRYFRLRGHHFRSRKMREKGTPTFGIKVKLENIRKIFQSFDLQHFKDYCTTYRNSEITQRCDLLTDHGPAKCRLKNLVSIVDTWRDFQNPLKQYWRRDVTCLVQTLSVRHVGLVCQGLPGRFLADDTRFESIAKFLTHDRPRTDNVFQHF